MDSCRILLGLKRNSSRKVAYCQACTGPASLAQSAKFRTWEKVMNLLHTSKPVRRVKQRNWKTIISDLSDFVIHVWSDLISYSMEQMPQISTVPLDWCVVLEPGTAVWNLENKRRQTCKDHVRTCTFLRHMIDQCYSKAFREAKMQLKFQLGPAMHQRSCNCLQMFKACKALLQDANFQ